MGFQVQSLGVSSGVGGISSSELGLFLLCMVGTNSFRAVGGSQRKAWVLICLQGLTSPLWFITNKQSVRKGSSVIRLLTIEWGIEVSGVSLTFTTVV